MLRKWSPLLLLVCLLSLTAVGFGTPTTVILGDSSPGQVLITNTGSDTTLAFTGSCGGPDCLTGLGYFGTNVGTYSMWFVSGRSGDLLLGSPNGDMFPINMNGNTIDFTFGYGSTFLDGTVVLNNVTDGTDAPRFIGGLFVTSTNLAGFRDGTYVDLDFNIYLGTNPTIDQVFSGQYHSTQGPISSGEIVPSTPEPSSIALFGSGVLGLAGLLRRKLNR